MPVLSPRTLPQRVTIQRATRVADGQGGFTETLATIATNVPCRLGQPPLDTFQEADGQLRSEARRDGWFPPATSLRTHDVVVMAGMGSLIVQAADLQADGVYVKAKLVEEQPGG